MSTVATTETKPGTPAIEKINVKVDGREIEVPRLMADWSGKLTPTTMIQACELAKTDVPHYCWHPKLPVVGNCRMCLVEFGTPSLGPRPQAGGQSRRHIQDRQVAASRHRVRHADFARNGNLH